MNAWDIILQVWPVPFIIIALAVIMFLRMISYYRRDEIETHNLARDVYRKRMEYELELKRQALVLMGVDPDDHYPEEDEDDDDGEVFVV